MTLTEQSISQDSTNTLAYQLANFIIYGTPAQDYDKLAELALSHSLGPLFLSCIKQYNIPVDNITAYKDLQSHVQFTTMIFLLQKWALQQVNQAFNQAGIRCIWFKGAALSSTIYETPSLRLKGDLDCIVPQADMPKALQILLDMDYEEVPDDELKLNPIIYERLSHHIGLHHKQKQHIKLELHRHLLGLSGPKLIPPDHLTKWINEAISFDLDGQSALTFRPEYHLLYLCAHAFLQHREDSVELRQLIDMHLLITAYTLDWDMLLDEAIALKWTFLLEFVLKRIVTYFRTPIDPDIFEKLLSMRPADEVIDHNYVMDHEFVDGEALYKYIGHLNYKEQLIAITQIVFPPQLYMRDRYEIAPQRPVFPYYIYRFVYQSKDMSLYALRNVINRIRS